MAFRYYGLWLWLPEIFNKLIEYQKEHPNDHKSVCEIVDSGFEPASTSNGNSTVDPFCLSPTPDAKVFVNSIYISLSVLPGNLWSIIHMDKLGRKFFLGIITRLAFPRARQDEPVQAIFNRLLKKQCDGSFACISDEHGYVRSQCLLGVLGEIRAGQPPGVVRLWPRIHYGIQCPQLPHGGTVPHQFKVIQPKIMLGSFQENCGIFLIAFQIYGFSHMYGGVEDGGHFGERGLWLLLGGRVFSPVGDGCSHAYFRRPCWSFITQYHKDCLDLIDV